MSNNEVVDKKDYDALFAENKLLKQKYTEIEEKLNSVIEKNSSSIETFFSPHIELKRAKKRFNTILEQSDKQSKKLLTDIEKKEELLVRNKLAHISEMISMIAHQWRQPLSVINNLVLAIDLKVFTNKENFNDEKNREEFFEYLSIKHNVLLKNISTMSAVIDDFKSFFKPNSQTELLPATTPIRNAISVISKSIEANNIKIIEDFNYDENILLQTSDIMGAILNILHNSDENFKVKKTINPFIKISVNSIDDELVICIGDNGGGIDKSIIEKIFDPYFSTKDDKNGTGLGLYTAKIIIEEHCHGTISVRNDKKGAIFMIKLPILTSI